MAERNKNFAGFIQKIIGLAQSRTQGTKAGGLFAPLFAKLAKRFGAKQQAAKEQPVGTMQPGYEAASRNTTLLS